ncbi:CgeB family protein [Sulfuriflexus mobilis]|uniref:CgeB family protein n=1 Tax=Sulfuriflexus mobilis TaxID=1811807 RepID=UPI000F83021C|nr:glycosyltransferase [Sulfuriflexus mobilis]
MTRLILYIGALAQGSTTKSRMRSLQSLGWQVLPFDTTPYLLEGNRAFRSIGARFNIGLGVSKLNKNLISWATNLSTDVWMIWVDKGTWIYPETIQQLKYHFRCMSIHYTPDAQILSQRSRHFIKSLVDYDFCVTTKEWEIDEYYRNGAKKVFLTLQGYSDDFVLRSPSPSELLEYEADVCFVGHFQNHYRARLEAIVRENIALKVRGDQWLKKRKRMPLLSGCIGHGLWGDSYPAALSCAKIGLGLLGKHIPETSTTRSFEIPAVGTFLLAERTTIHQELFEEEVEAEFFADDLELIDKIKFYLKNIRSRERIASAGYQRCIKSGYSSRKLLEALMANVIREI